MVVPSLFGRARATELLGYAEIPVIDVQVDPLDRVARLFKRAFDVTVRRDIAPRAPAAGVADRAGHRGGVRFFPVSYAQERVGRNARHFQVLQVPPPWSRMPISA